MAYILMGAWGEEGRKAASQLLGELKQYYGSLLRKRSSFAAAGMGWGGGEEQLQIY